MTEAQRRCQRKYRERKKALLNDLKREGCCVCGVVEPLSKLHFHHRNPDEKLFTIGKGLHKRADQLLAEAAKCDIICVTCHALKHGEGCSEAGIQRAVKVVERYRPELLA